MHTHACTHSRRHTQVATQCSCKQDSDYSSLLLPSKCPLTLQTLCLRLTSRTLSRAAPSLRSSSRRTRTSPSWSWSSGLDGLTTGGSLTTLTRCQVGGQCCLVLHLMNRSTPPHRRGVRRVVSVVWYYTSQTGPPHHIDKVSGGWSVLSGTTPHKQVNPTTVMRCWW